MEQSTDSSFEFERGINETLEEEGISAVSAEKDVYRELITVFGLIGGSSALLIFITLMRLKNSLWEHHYKYILHWSGLALIYTIIFPVFARVFMKHSTYPVYCTAIEFYVLSVILTWVIFTLMAFDSVLSVHFQAASLKFRRRSHLVFTIVYIFAIFFLCSILTVCISSDYISFAFLFAPFVYLICFVGYVTILVIYNKKKRIDFRYVRFFNNTPLVVAGVYLGTWGVKVVIAFFVLATEDSYPILIRCFVFSIAIALINPFIILIILCKIDYNFRTHLTNILKCKKSTPNEETQKFDHCHYSPNEYIELNLN